MAKKIEISYKTIVFTVLFLLGLWVLYLIKDILLAFFVSLLIMAILNPLVTKLSKYNIPRAVSVILVYFFVIGLLAVSFIAIIPPLISQTSNFLANLPMYISRLGVSYDISEYVVGQLTSDLGEITRRAASITVSVFSNIIGIVTVLVFAFYLLLMRDNLDEHLGIFFDSKRRKLIVETIEIVERKMGSWATGQIILMFAVGFANYIGLSLLGVPYALPLAIFAGFLEIVPYLGPILAAIPPILIGLGISPFLGFSALALAFIIQQLENYVLVPKIMQSSTGVDPIVTLVALAIGFQLAGIVGVLIAVPVVIIIQVIFFEIYLKRKFV
ncbi:MAG: AI-2E family transporter [Patescibacteria group bacterium]|nr:AI-2E family transporter [Patescibacteria group bacterium]